MIISLNWLKKFVDIDTKIDDLVALIGARLVEVEDVKYIGDKYKDVLIVRVISAEPVEGSDHLSLTKIDDGGKCQTVERDENGFVQVVCGAPNITAGQLVAWLPPESIVPETYNDAEPFKLGIRNLRGKISNGMIASGKELAISDDHEGILEIDGDIPAGTSFAKQFELDDYLLNIENKSLTHRPDCFGIIGFAREVAAITGKQFVSPDWIMNLAPYFGEGTGEIKVTIDDANLSDRYQAIVMIDGDGKKHSPILVQTYLARVGVRPISAIVDVTNYLMMLTGQPLHAFDFDKMAKAAGDTYDYEIHVRAGHGKERLELLDGRVIELSSDDIVIAAGDIAVGLAGAMGGLSTVIDENTRAIIIESASFNLYKLRTTQMRHGIFSEAITRFTKGQPAELTAPVLGEAVRLIKDWAGAKAVTAVADAYPGKASSPTIKVPLNVVNEILGSDFGMLQLTTVLGNAEFGLDTESPYTIIVKSPYWRSDIHSVEDIVEEVGRLNGFDNINPVLPMRDFNALKPTEFDDFRKKLRKIITRAGANEVLTYSFIHGDTLKKAGQDPQNSYKIVNSISPDLQYYRQTLTTSLLGLVNINSRQGYDDFALYELNRIHQKADGLNEEGVPIERNSAAFIITNKAKQVGSAYYKARSVFDYLCKNLNYEVKYEKMDSLPDDPLFAPFEYRHSAKIVDKNSNNIIGVVGEYKKSVSKGFKLPECTAGFEIYTDSLFTNTHNLGYGYTPVNRYPVTDRDICFRVNSDVCYGQIIDILNNEISGVQMNIEILPVDIYKPKDLEMKNITVRVKLSAADRTLTGDEVSLVISGLCESVVAKTGAVVI